MRKDVQNLAEIFSTSSAKSDRDVDILRWPNAQDIATRYEVLLSSIDFSLFSPENPLRLLDVGCGFGLLLDWLAENDLLDKVSYTGVDLLESMLAEARQRWPDQHFDLRDVRDEPYAENAFDYCIVCGIFTVKHGNTYQETVALAQDTLKSIWPSVRLGLAFNSMSKHVDWERDDLFHWPLDDIMAFCKRDLSRHVSFRLDYGLWEGASLVRKEHFARSSKAPARW